MSAAPSPVLPALALLSALASGPAAASVLKLDGIPDEPIWHDAQVFDDFRITNPYTLGPPTHATVARLLALPEDWPSLSSVTSRQARRA
ncbi:hypothetical protein [Pseudofulvimonas gallinarii]|uniref:hypothetical protein n=1 Tax=Pseudofulvimonas gallinarii TaxID=634155 RepID=UPI0035F04F26